MKKHILLLLLLPSLAVCCNDLSDIENRIDAVEQQVKSLEETVDALEMAYNNSLAINSSVNSVLNFFEGNAVNRCNVV